MITIIIPTYKPEEYLSECLLSLEAQTIPKEAFLVYIILNGEKNPFLSKIENWVKPLTLKCKILFTEKQGVSYARNIGLENSVGKYIAFIDDDDYVSPTYLESLLACADSAREGTIVCSDVRTFDNEGNISTDYISRAYSKATANPNDTGIFFRRSFLSSSCCKLIPRSVIGDRRFQQGIKIGEDSLFMAAISDRIKNIVPASPNAIYYRRLRQGSATRSGEKGSTRIRRKFNLISIYVRLFIRHLPNYNLLFFLSRILATIRN